MTKQELAKKLGISRNTLYEWEKTKPELVRLINLGLMADKQIEATRKLMKQLEEIKEKAEGGKFIKD